MLDNYKAIIHELYVVQRKTLDELLLLFLKDNYDLQPSPRTMRRRLSSWGFSRNLTRPQVFSLLRANNDTTCRGQDSRPIRPRPVPARQLESYLKRTRLDQTLPLYKNPAPSPVWRVPEFIFSNSAAFVNGSFESATWVSAGDELLIASSANQHQEKVHLHSFLGHIDTAISVASRGDFETAREHWTSAFENVDVLITGHYHDHLPNILQKINDLQAQGFSAVATELQNYLAESVKAHGVRTPMAKIFEALRLVHLSDMKKIEERTMQIYLGGFERHLGLRHYNSFVMRMNLARRILRATPTASLDDHIPSLAKFDDMFGPCDARSLDIIRLRTEILDYRGQYGEAGDAAELLVGRASLKADDEWQRLYLSIQGYYYLGLARYAQDLAAAAKSCFSDALELVTQLSVIDANGIFNPEKLIMQDHLSKDDLRAGREYSNPA